MSTLATKQISPDSDRAQRYIEQTRVGLIGATIGLSEAQWNFKPAPDRWSIAENLEREAPRIAWPATSSIGDLLRREDWPNRDGDASEHRPTQIR